MQVRTLKYCYTTLRKMKSQTLTAPNPGEDVKKQEFSHSLMMRMQNDTATLGDSLVLFQK
jgi:hypothetical protein